ncbi:MAG: L-threonylcarbamoyladenylate synthase [Burkholderiales bacterium]
MGSTPDARRIRAHLQRGGVIAYATESCFGLGCDPRNQHALTRLLLLKGRPKRKGLILVAADLSQLARYIAPLGPAQREILMQSWPGPHTWLVPVRHGVSPLLRGRHTCIAVRVTAHPDSIALCRSMRSALVSTSANRAGLKPLRSYRACVKSFGNQVLVIPGRIGIRKTPSTIRDLVSGKTLRF